MQRIASKTVAFALTVAASGCSDRAGSADWQARTDTVGDTLVVRTLSGSVWGQPLRLEREMDIGVADGPEAYVFGEIGGIAIGSTGTVYVVDTQAPALRSYSSDGRFLATFGGVGKGPGEYMRPDGGVAALRDGRVLLRDPGNARINVYAPDGSPLEHWDLPLGGAFVSSRPLFTDSAGHIYTVIVLEFTPDVYAWRWGLARYTPDGILRDTLPAPRWEYEEALIHGSRDKLNWSARVPFTPAADWTFSPFGYYVGGLSTEYRINLFRSEALTLRIEREWEPVRLPAAERRDAERVATHEMRRMFPDWTWRGPSVPNEKPPFRDVFAGEDGLVWVAISQPGEPVKDKAEQPKETGSEDEDYEPRFREPVAFDVFDESGRYLGRVDAPPDFSLNPEPIFTNPIVWAVSVGEDGIPRVVRYRLRHSSF